MTHVRGITDTWYLGCTCVWVFLLDINFHCVRSDKVTVLPLEKLCVVKHPAMPSERFCVGPFKWKRSSWIMLRVPMADGDRMSCSPRVKILWDQNHREAEPSCLKFHFILLIFYFPFFMLSVFELECSSCEFRVCSRLCLAFLKDSTICFSLIFKRDLNCNIPSFQTV